MANIFISLLSVVLIYNTVAQGRQTLYTNNELLASSPAGNDGGICQIMVETKGYTCEEHQVKTQDGYILSLQRIPVGRSRKPADKPPVLLQHGIFVDAIIWLLNSPDESLAFILADNGFDVWLSSTRGTKYSRGHTSISIEERAYWDWSFDELISYDFPASVGYVFNHTGGKKLHYVGHSLGTLTALAALSQDSQQNLQNMLRSAALLSPIAHLSKITSKVIRFAADRFLARLLYWLGLAEFIPNGGVADKLLHFICLYLRVNCTDLLTLLTGPNCCLNSSRTDIFFENEPQPTATKNLIHLSQMITLGTIAKYDYGYNGNMEHYGKPSPPLYDMASFPKEFPLFVANGGQDMLSDVEDVKDLLNDLKDHDGNKLKTLFNEAYAHADFVLGINAKQMVYDPMIAFLNVN